MCPKRLSRQGFDEGSSISLSDAVDQAIQIHASGDKVLC